MSDTAVTTHEEIKRAFNDLRDEVEQFFDPTKTALWSLAGLIQDAEDLESILHGLGGDELMGHFILADRIAKLRNVLQPTLPETFEVGS